MDFDCENQVTSPGVASGGGAGSRGRDGRTHLSVPWRARAIGRNYKTGGWRLLKGWNKKGRQEGRQKKESGRNSCYFNSQALNRKPLKRVNVICSFLPLYCCIFWASFYIISCLAKNCAFSQFQPKCTFVNGIRQGCFFFIHFSNPVHNVTAYLLCEPLRLKIIF